MKKRTKNIIISGGVIALLYFLYSKISGNKPTLEKVSLTNANLGAIKPKSPLKKPRTQPMVVYGGGGGKGGGHFTQTFPDTVPMPTQQGHTTEGNNQSGGKVPIQVVIPYVDNSNNVNL
jgi:hypothetical protein|tara:strand:- start:2098 stop:2454 length:357 start_codon:yes stop_codon:yes gene_type:complete